MIRPLRTGRRLNDPRTSTGAAGTRCRLCGDSRLRDVGTVDGFAFAECARCRVIFIPELDRDALESIYWEGDRGEIIGPPPEEGWADVGFLRPAFEHLPANRSLDILDFGTGESIVPDRLRAAGHRVIAVDLAPPTNPHPHRLTGDLLALQLPSAAFDLTYTFQVFEHLPEPRAIFEELLRVTRPGGLVLIHTDMETEERQMGFANWWYVIPPKHCTFYRTRTFDVLLDGRPHEVIWRDAKSVLIRRGE